MTESGPADGPRSVDELLEALQAYRSARGVILVNGHRVASGDGIAAIDEPVLTITAEEDAEFVLVGAA